MKLLQQYIAVGIAGFIGSVARFGLGMLFGRFGLQFPVGTLVINVTGSFILGWFLTYATLRQNISDTMRLAIGTGFVGAYTTFSTYMYETDKLARGGANIMAMANLIISLVLGLIAVRLGIALGNKM